MSWVDKAIRKRDTYKRTNGAILNVTYLGLLYLESNFHCKKKGLQKFVDFMYKNLVEIGKNRDNEFFIECDKYFRDNYGIEVAKLFNVDL